MTPLFKVLLLVGGLLLMSGAGAGWLWLRLNERQQALQRRLESVGEPYVRSRPAEGPPITRRRVAEPQPLVRRLARLFGYDLGGSDEGMRWYLVLPVTFVVSIVASELTGALLGGADLLVAPPCWVMLSRTLWGWRREKRLARALAQFPDALAMIVRAVRIGIPVAEAVRIVAREAREPTARSFAELADEVTIGVPLDAALRRMAERTGLAEYRFFATAITLQAQTGGALAETLDNLADVIRRRLALRARGRALSSEARASIAMLAALPVLGGLMMYMLNPGYIGVLFTDPTGRNIFGMAVVSLGAGLLIMRVMMSRVLA
jgi:tight adherence protein B